MAQIIKLKRSSIPGATPDITQVELGEIAINTYDGKLFVLTDDGTPKVEQIFVTNTLVTGSLNLAQDTVNPTELVRIVSGAEDMLKVDQDGLLVLGEKDSTPTAVEGGIMYSGSQFYLGI